MYVTPTIFTATKTENRTKGTKQQTNTEWKKELISHKIHCFYFLASVQNQIATALTLELLLVAFHISQNFIF